MCIAAWLAPAPPPAVLDLPEEASYAARPLSGGLNATARTHQAYDERPAMGKGRYAADEQLSSPGGAPQRPQEPVSDGLPAPRGWPGDLPTPEPLSGAQQGRGADGNEEDVCGRGGRCVCKMGREVLHAHPVRTPPGALLGLPQVHARGKLAGRHMTI